MRSYRAGKCEAVFWKGTSRLELKRVLLAARKFELFSRESGSRSGSLGHIALEILELFTNLIDFKTGRLDPSLDTMMRMLKRSKDAIVRGLKALKDHGFLNWIRRYVPTNEQGRGPQIRQTSNAYKLMIPKLAQKLLGRYGIKEPEPEDEEYRRLSHHGETEAYFKSLTLEERPLFLLDDSPLARSLARLGKLITERESVKRSESQSSFKIPVTHGPTD